jgi:hypothetical protein
MDKFSFFDRRVKETVFKFETVAEDPDRTMFEVYDLPSSSYYLLSSNDIEDNTYNLDFLTKTVTITKWFDFKSSNDLKWIDQAENTGIATLVEERVLFLMKSPTDTNGFFIDTEHNGPGNGIKTGGTPFNFDRDFVCHFIADKERNANNQRITYGMRGVGENKLLVMRQSSTKFHVKFKGINLVSGKTRKYYTFVYPNQAQYEFKVFTLIHKNNKLRFYYNGNEILNSRDIDYDSYTWKPNSSMSKNSVNFNSRAPLDFNDYRGKTNRVKHFSFEYIKPGYNLQLDINNLITKYGL